MNKKSLITFSIVIVSLILLGLYLIIKDNAKTVSEIEGLTFLINDGTLTNTSATIEIKNNSIEKKRNGKWKKNKTIKKDVWWDAVEIVVSKNEHYKEDINWLSIYGKLKKGKYRLVKEINNTRVAVEFSID